MENTVIGITGGIGSGKSLIVSFIEKEYKASVIQADLIGHEVIRKGEPGYDRTVEILGDEILQKDGEIDRKIMADKVFSDAFLLNEVNSVIHPLVEKEIEKKIDSYAKNKTEITLLEAALPEQSFMKKFCGIIWYVYVPDSLRIYRLMKSRGYTREKTLSIIESQIKPDEYRRLCDCEIDNTGIFSETEKRVGYLISK